MESSDLVLYGTVDAKLMICDAFEDEVYAPVILGDDNKAVISIAFKDIKDSDSGRYYEVFYATYVSPKDKGPLNAPFKTPFSLLEVAEIPETHAFCLSILCGDSLDNPGGAKRGIHCGREIFGVPKHPNPGNVRFHCTEKDGKIVEINVEGSHNNDHVVSMRCKLPSQETTCTNVSIDVPKNSGNSIIGGPCYGGMHKGFNGAFQGRIDAAVNCTMSIACWNDDTDYLKLGNDTHFAMHLKKWNFKPMVKAYSDNFKICLFKPSGWMSGEEISNALKQYEASNIINS